MAEMEQKELFGDFLGSAHIFAYALGEVLEHKLWREAAGDTLGVSHLKVLKLISLNKGQTIGDVANFLGVSNAAASKTVDKLASRMLIRRSQGEADRRAIYLSLTGAGRRVLEAYEHSIYLKLATILGSFSSDELRQGMDLLDRLSTQIVHHCAKAEEICVQCGIHYAKKCLLKQQLDRECIYRRQRGGSDS